MWGACKQDAPGKQAGHAREQLPVSTPTHAGLKQLWSSSCSLCAAGLASGAGACFLLAASAAVSAAFASSSSRTLSAYDSRTDLSATLAVTWVAVERSEEVEHYG